MGGDRLDDDAAFALVSNRRRRLLIALLCACDGEVSIDDAADAVARAERDRGDTSTRRPGRAESVRHSDGESTAHDGGAGTASSPTDEQVRSVYVSLYQTHVPRLADHDVVAYDDESRTVRLRDSAATRRLLRVSGLLDERPWWLYYLVATGLVWVVIVAATLQTGPASAVDWVVAVLVATGALAATVTLRRLTHSRWRVDDGRLRQFAPGIAHRCRETSGWSLR